MKYDEPRLIRLPEVLRRTGLSKSSIYRREAEGTFCKRVKLGDRVTCYREDEVSAWVEARTAEARGTK